MSDKSLSAERKLLQNKGYLPEWFTTGGWQLFKEKYLYGTDEAFLGHAKRIAKTAAQYTTDPAYWEPKFFHLIWSGWLSCSTPVLANTGTNRGYSVSCSGQFIDDSVDSFYSGLRETALLSKGGFGTSGYFGNVRPRGSDISFGGKSSGIVPVIEDYFIACQKISQGGTRRGSFGAYVPLMHGDFDEVADMLYNSPDDANIGWNVYDRDIEALNNNDPEVDRRRKRTFKIKSVTGKGYFFFPDKVNRHRPQMYIDNDWFVEASNLCTEITLFCDNEHTYTCVLSSMNLLHYDEWKDTDAVFTATVFLDCIASDFIAKARNQPGMEKAVRFTEKTRALGLGVCGFHSYLQEKMIPFESLDAHFVNNEIFTHIQQESTRASKWMAIEFGEPELCKGYGYRNTHRTAIAPTMSTALIMGGISQCTEPVLGNAFIQSSAAGEIERINPIFLKLMKARGKYSRKTIEDIASKNGSVQHLDWLTDHEKLVFRTAFEINQEVILRLAASRQPKLCQAQSINLFFSADESEEYISRILEMAFINPWIFSLYYMRTQSGIETNKGCFACQ